MKLRTLLILLWLMLLLCPKTSKGQNEIIQQLDKIRNRPKKIKIENQIEIENGGGHLQGVQAYRYQDEDYYFFSGSSKIYGYLAVADKEEVKRLHIVGDLPLKHAGGFQLAGPWLAVGVEDNEARNLSEVKVYRIDNPLAIDIKPAGVVKRQGDWERATAGAIAVCELENELVLLVGDWSNRHIDFYQVQFSEVGSEYFQFEKTAEISLANVSRNNWIESEAWPYQNINLIKYQGEIYLFGFSSGPGDKNLMDVYFLENLKSKTPVLTKVYQRIFKRSKITRFGWGAGISFDEKAGFTIYACGENFQEETVFVAYKSKD